MDTLPVSRPLLDLVPADALDADRLKLPTLDAYWHTHALIGNILDNHRPLLSPATAGLGGWFEHVLGGGLQPGEVLGVGAAGAGQGKTAFVHQLADGWAEANGQAWAGRDPSRQPRVWPILYVSEMSVRAMTIRTLARRAAIPGKLLRAPAHYGESGRQAVHRAAKAAQAFTPALPFITPIDRAVNIGTGEQAVRTLGHHAARVAEQWQKDGADVGGVVLVIDPLHRLLETGVDETGALTDILGALLAETQERGLVTIFTSDTTKSAAGARNGSDDPAQNDPERDAEQAFRGNYQLLHVPDHVIALRTFDPEKAERWEKVPAPMRDAYSGRHVAGDAEWATVLADLPSPKLRWGKVGDRPAYWYDRALFRFEPIPRPARLSAPAPRKQDVLL